MNLVYHTNVVFVVSESMPQLFVPQFTGSSYMQIPLDDSAISKMMTIEVWFRPLRQNGQSPS